MDWLEPHFPSLWTTGVSYSQYPVPKQAFCEPSNKSRLAVVGCRRAAFGEQRPAARTFETQASKKTSRRFARDGNISACSAFGASQIYYGNVLTPRSPPVDRGRLIITEYQI
jgi:hypothetical protein